MIRIARNSCSRKSADYAGLDASQKALNIELQICILSCETQSFGMSGMNINRLSKASWAERMAERGIEFQLRIQFTACKAAEKAKKVDLFHVHVHALQIF